MKTINITFTDGEFGELKKRKGKLSWHDFIMKGGTKRNEKNTSYNRGLNAVADEQV